MPDLISGMSIKRKNHLPMVLRSHWVSLLFAAVFLLFASTPAFAAISSSKYINFQTTQNMWQATGGLDTTWPLFELPIDTGPQRNNSKLTVGTTGFSLDFGYDVSTRVAGNVKMNLDVNRTGNVDVNYAGTYTINYPDPRSFGKGDSFTITTSVIESVKHIKTISPVLTSELYLTGSLSLEASMKMILAGYDIPIIDQDFGTLDWGVHLFKLDSGTSDVQSPGATGFYQKLPYVITENSDVFTRTGITGTFQLPPLNIDQNFPVNVSGSSKPYANLSLDLDSRLKIPYPKSLYIRGGKSGKILGANYSASYDVLDLKYWLKVYESQELTFTPSSSLTMTFSTPVRYCVTDNTTTTPPALTDLCWTAAAQSSATFPVGKSVHINYPATAPDSIIFAPSFSLPNTFRNKTVLHFEEPLIFDVMKAQVKMDKFVVIPEICFPEVKGYYWSPWSWHSYTITDAYCSSEVAFNGFDFSLDPLWSTALASTSQEGTTFESAWPLQFQPVSGNPLEVKPKLLQPITITGQPASSAYKSTFTVGATGGGSGLPVVINASGGCSGSGNNSATITMTSGTTACTVRYSQAGTFDYYAAETTRTTTTRKLNQTITVTTGAPASAVYNTSFPVVVATNSSPELSVAIAASGGCSGSGTNSATITMTSGTTACTVLYSQTGNGNYNAAAQITETITAQKKNQAITVTTKAPADAVFNGSFPVAATSTSGLPVSIARSGGCGGTGTETATVTMTNGTIACTVDYSQSGDDNYHPAAQIRESVTAKSADSSITVSSHKNPSLLWRGDNYWDRNEFTATVTSSVAGTITGTVTFSDNGVDFCSEAVSSGGAYCSTDSLVKGAHTIRARYSGDSNYVSASATLMQTVVSTPMYVEEQGAASGICDSWTNACSLQYALGLAPQGAEIWVKAGTYKPTSGTDRTATFQLKPGVALYGGFSGTETALSERDFATNITILSGDLGEDDANVTMMDGRYAPDLIIYTTEFHGNEENSYHVITGSGASPFVGPDMVEVGLDGFTISGGNATGTSPHDAGGAIYTNGGFLVVNNVIFSENMAHHGAGMYNEDCYSSLKNVTFTKNGSDYIGNGGGMFNQNSQVSLENVSFSSNSGGLGGGGLYDNLSSTNLKNVTFTGNTAYNGGGGIYNYSSVSHMENVTLSGNIAHKGGGIYNDNVDTDAKVVTLRKVTFSGNRTTDYGEGAAEGGGMYNVSSSPEMTDVTFSGNRSNLDGGGMYNSSSSPVLINVTFSDNHAFGNGGGMYNSGGSPDVTNATFSRNFADQNGGGIYNQNANPDLLHVTLTRNLAGLDGAAFYANGGNPTLTNSIIWGNKLPDIGYNSYYQVWGGFQTATNNVIEGCGSIEEPPPPPGLCNYATGTDPKLDTLGNYGGYTQTIRLLAGSSALDAINMENCYWMDQRGFPRLQPTSPPQEPPHYCDMGAYEAGSKVHIGYFTGIIGGGAGGGFVDGLQTVEMDVDVGAEVTVTATANTAGGYHFVRWLTSFPLLPGEPVVSTSNPRIDRPITEPFTATAMFSQYYELTYTAGANGSIDGMRPPGSYMVTAGPGPGHDGMPVPAIPDSGYHFVTWSDGSTANPRTDSNVTAELSVIASFAKNTYDLAYNSDANGSIVGKNRQQIVHAADGTPVTAAANANYHFVNWSDGSTDNPRTDTALASNLTVTANFAVDPRTITYAAGANGSITGTTPQTVGHGSAGSAVTAVGNTGYHFNNWSDGSTQNPRTDTNVTADLSVTANFGNVSTLLYTAGPNGSITGITQQTVTDGGNGTAVTAVPGTIYRFVNWSDGSTANPRTDTGVSGNISVTANFALKSYTLTYTAGTHGSITGTGSQTVNHGGYGTQVTAVPAPGYHFVNWSDGSEENPRTDTNVTADIPVTASFAITTYTATYAAGENGSITGTTPQTVNHGASSSQVEAVPATGYYFVKWSDETTTNPRTDTNVTANISVTASFAINTYTLTYTAGANGSITGTTPQNVNHGATGTGVTAVPAEGYHFVKWDDNSTMNPRTDADVTANISVTAIFSNTWTLAYAAGPNGSITGTSPQTVQQGKDGTDVTAVANANYHFVDWSGGSTANPRTDTNVTADIYVTANFASNTYTVTYNAGSNGSISGDTPQTVSYGGSGTEVTAVPATGYHFVAWSDGSLESTRTDTNIVGTMTVTANFAINTYVVTYTAGPNGSITGMSTQTVNHGASGTEVTAVPASGYHFVDWSDGSEVNPRTDTNVSADIPVTANFAINRMYVVNEAGQISGICENWMNACDLQYALGIAKPGTEVWVQAGTYKPTTGTERTATFNLKKSVAVYGGFGGTETELSQRDITTNITILSGDIGLPGDNSDNSYHVVTGSWTNNATILDGFTITGGNANGDGSDGNGTGGGMYNRGGSPTLANLLVNANRASNNGGGMFNYDNSSPIISNVTFSGNSAQQGGGIYNQINSSPIILNVTFSGNTGAKGGGGMFNHEYSSPALSNVTFSGNTAADGDGGGMSNNSYSSPTITDASFSGNTASNNGGGMFNSTNSSPVVTNTTFSGNAAGMTGGGMFNSTNSNPSVSNVTFSGNTANMAGGGMSNLSSSPTLWNVTLSGNMASHADGNGGGMHNTDSSNPVLHNTIVWGNTATYGSQIYSENAGTKISAPTITYSIVQGGCPDGSTCSDLIQSDPLLDPSGLQDNSGPTRTIALRAASPAIDAADDSSCPATDQRGITRPQGDRCDIGAYEFTLVTLTYTAGPNGSITGTSPQTVNRGANGSEVTAVPATGYRFVNWSDGSTANPRTDTSVTGNMAVTANFAILPSLTVTIAGTGSGTVTSVPSGISCTSGSCTNSYSGTVGLYATPSSLSLFGGWNGGCTGAATLCSIAMNGSQAVTATFNPASLLHIDGTAYPSLQKAYDAAATGAVIQLLANTVTGTLDADRNVTVQLKGGYDAGYTANPGTSAVTAPLTIRQGNIVADKIVIE